jgi:hypothetical protein
MKPLLWLSIAMCFFISCSKLADEIILQQKNTSPSPGFVEYKIPKGNHYAQANVFKQLHRNELRFQVVFDSSAIYQTIKPENQYDINKLYGFSDCETMHHENSARFGWRWNARSVELYAYWYNDSTRHHQFLDNVSIGQTVELAIKALPQQYQFSIKKATYLFPRNCSSTLVNGYLLYPYFGGDETAPHDIRIRIKELPN